MDISVKAANVIMALYDITEKLDNEHKRIRDESMSIGKEVYGLTDPKQLDDMTPADAIQLSKSLGRIEAHTEEMAFITDLTGMMAELMKAMAGQEEGA